MNTTLGNISCLNAIITIRDWYLSPESDYPRNATRRAVAAMKDLRMLNQTAFDQICDLAEKCDVVRSNGWSTVYLNDCQLGDPHKGNQPAKAAICIDCLMRVYDSEMDRAGFRA